MLYGDTMADILYEAAVAYNRLKNIVYEIILGRKGKSYTIRLHFPAESFFHLAGLQHLTDITYPSTNKERIFKEILAKRFTYESISSSVFLRENFVDERIQNMYLLEIIFDSNTVSYLINHNEYKKYTSIKADYLFEYKNIECDVFYFFSFIERMRPRFQNECKGCSYFKKHETDFTKGTSKTTVLMITKIENYREEGLEKSYIKILLINIRNLLSFYNTP